MPSSLISTIRGRRLSSSRPTFGRATACTGRRPRSIPPSPRERFRDVSERSLFPNGRLLVPLMPSSFDGLHVDGLGEIGLRTAKWAS